MRRASLVLLLAVAVVPPRTTWAQSLVRYEGGGRFVQGIQLLQDYADSSAYYYVPQFPRLARRSDGTFELLVIKYVGAGDQASGGLFHALVEFTLPPDVVQLLERELRRELPRARIVGPVPLRQAVQEGDEIGGSFRLVSATLASTGDGGLTRSVITAGTAPLVPGSKAAVAALLRPEGATLLWNSLTGPTSDVSVEIHAYYEALVEGYNAKVTADVSTVYEHFSTLSNVQREFTRRQLRDVADQLRQNGVLRIDVLDRTAGLGIKAKEMEGILDLVTNKLSELLFDHKTGWAAEPPREVAVDANQIPGRQEEGFFAKVFGGGDTKYYSDNQYVLKRREDIRQHVFSLVLSKRSTVKVPVDATGNLGALYEGLGGDPRHFRVVNLSDPSFEFRPVHFQLDAAYVDAFQDLINFVTVNVRKAYSGNPAFTQSFQLTLSDIKAGKTLHEVAFPRLGQAGPEWQEYEYQVRWSLRGGATVLVPGRGSEWIRTADAAVSLSPPFERSVVEIDADRDVFRARGVATAVVRFATVLAGQPRRERQVTLRVGDAEPTKRVALYHDRGESVAYRVAWYRSGANARLEAIQLLDADYLYLTPPDDVTSPGRDGPRP